MKIARQILKIVSSPLWFPVVFASKRCYKAIIDIVESGEEKGQGTVITRCFNGMFQISLIPIGLFTGITKGVLIGALIGSCIPGAGTLVGSIIGGILGAAYGMAMVAYIGKYLSKLTNYITIKCNGYKNRLIVSPTNPHKYQPTCKLNPKLTQSYVAMLKVIRREKNKISFIDRMTTTKAEAYHELIEYVKASTTDLPVSASFSGLGSFTITKQGNGIEIDDFHVDYQAPEVLASCSV